jgi:hypothetical protein
VRGHGGGLGYVCLLVAGIAEFICESLDLTLHLALPNAVAPFRCAQRQAASHSPAVSWTVLLRKRAHTGAAECTCIGAPSHTQFPARPPKMDPSPRFRIQRYQGALEVLAIAVFRRNT